MLLQSEIKFSLIQIIRLYKLILNVRKTIQEYQQVNRHYCIIPIENLLNTLSIFYSKFSILNIKGLFTGINLVSDLLYMMLCYSPGRFFPSISGIPTSHPLSGKYSIYLSSLICTIFTRSNNKTKSLCSKILFSVKVNSKI